MGFENHSLDYCKLYQFRENQFRDLFTIHRNNYGVGSINKKGRWIRMNHLRATTLPKLAERCKFFIFVSKSTFLKTNLETDFMFWFPSVVHKLYNVNKCNCAFRSSKLERRNALGLQTETVPVHSKTMSVQAQSGGASRHTIFSMDCITKDRAAYCLHV